MDEYTFQIFTEDLKIGREFNFSYKNKKYFISRGKGVWFLSYDKEKEPFTFKDVEDLLTNARIEGAKLEDIWDEVEVTSIF
ncbi:hypothetical protein [Aneurinibacillus migulanus]|uniref:Uncharacterized protein n=1 Tax=Aneurinibacillus migulanus TaxID=47500 RepID=A0A0D1XGY9_ANEMI|nr:hypothetical protein [Aneurinibacillus migulanus]KIV51533.1 hypothetical protein TS65_27385 [Aneurinibacillus migulanus]KON97571.1 hypothetical protein AF333_21010 [Aneurinibacillus migulanus]MED0894168.1 hypothetical protein [Aneurinibacillus migulanus]MED1619645.1 hypothetical protein [Aneurinibacillus migulanus]SDK11537.1 hypothetical protein SAMN04487909_13937 [Aneurinibacillus migulanus]